MGNFVGSGYVRIIFEDGERDPFGPVMTMDYIEEVDMVETELIEDAAGLFVEGCSFGWMLKRDGTAITLVDGEEIDTEQPFLARWEAI